MKIPPGALMDQPIAEWELSEAALEEIDEVLRWWLLIRTEMAPRGI
jgi:hypothetical protein